MKNITEEEKNKLRELLTDIEKINIIGGKYITGDDDNSQIDKTIIVNFLIHVNILIKILLNIEVK